MEKWKLPHQVLLDTYKTQTRQKDRNSEWIKLWPETLWLLQANRKNPSRHVQRQRPFKNDLTKARDKKEEMADGTASSWRAAKNNYQIEEIGPKLVLRMMRGTQGSEPNGGLLQDWSQSRLWSDTRTPKQSKAKWSERIYTMGTKVLKWEEQKLMKNFT